MIKKLKECCVTVPCICMRELGNMLFTSCLEPDDLLTFATVLSGDAWLGRKSLAQYELPASASV